MRTVDILVNSIWPNSGNHLVCHPALGRMPEKPLIRVSYFFQRFAAAFRAISPRRSGDIALALAAPPLAPSAFALGSLPSSVGSVSTSSPVAIRITLTALPMTSAGRFWPLGPVGIRGFQTSYFTLHRTRLVGLCRP